VTQVSPTIVDVAGGADIEVRGGPFFDSSRWTCQFAGATAVQARYVADDKLRCRSPLAVASAGSAVSIYLNGTLYAEAVTGADNAAVTFVDCGAQKTCGNCTAYAASSGSNCGWCVGVDGFCGSPASCDAVGASRFFVTDACPAVATVAPTGAAFDGATRVVVTGSLLVNDARLACQFGEDYTTPVDEWVSLTEVSCLVPKTDDKVDSDLDHTFAIVNADDGTVYASTAQAFTQRPPSSSFDRLSEATGLSSEETSYVIIGILAGAALLVALSCCYARRANERASAASALGGSGAAALSGPLPPKLTAASEKALLFGDLPSTRVPLKLSKDVRRDLDAIIFDDLSVMRATALCTSGSALTAFAKAAVYLHASRGSCVTLLNYFISSAVQATSSRAELFQPGSPAQQLFAVFARMYGLEYARLTLGGAVSSQVRSRAAETDFTLQLFVSSALNTIFSSARNLPLDMAAIFANLRQELMSRFPVTTDSLTDAMYETLKKRLLEAKFTMDDQVRVYNQVDDLETDLSTTLGDGRSARATEHLANAGGASATGTDKKVARLELAVSALETSVNDVHTNVALLAASAADLATSLSSSSTAKRQLVDKAASRQVASTVGSFLLGRFLEQALMNPESYGLTSEPLSGRARRSLVSLAKVLQNVVSQGLFSSAEESLSKLNPLLEESKPRALKFFDEVSRSADTSGAASRSIKLPDDAEKWALAIVHHAVVDNATEVQAKLTEMNRPGSAARVKAYLDAQ
jgi:hypothetical protein